MNQLTMNQLQSLRIKAGLTQEQLAKMSGTARTTIISLEQGKRPARPTTLAKLANVLGVSLSDLQESKTAPAEKQEQKTVKVNLCIDSKVFAQVLAQKEADQ